MGQHLVIPGQANDTIPIKFHVLLVVSIKTKLGFGSAVPRNVLQFMYTMIKFTCDQ